MISFASGPIARIPRRPERIPSKQVPPGRRGLPGDIFMLISGLSGNELFCLAQKGWAAGDVVVGNSVYSLGLVRGFTSGLQTLAGGELTSVTELISDGRHAAQKRMEEEAA